jgi:HTH-type transcriptional regulator/antitoxin HigA
MDIRPIRTDQDHRAALAAIDACWGAPEGSEEGDKLDVLVALVESYEARRWPIDSDKRFDPIDVLDYAIEELGHTQSELAELLGSRSRASEILARRRALTVDMIHKLSEAWKIPADLLVRPYRIDSAAWQPTPRSESRKRRIGRARRRRLVRALRRDEGLEFVELSLGPQVEAVLEDSRSGIAVGVVDGLVHQTVSQPVSCNGQ